MKKTPTSTSRKTPSPSRAWSAFTLLMFILAVASPLAAQGKKFYPDDPIALEPETRDASAAKPRSIDLMYDLMMNLFGQPKDPRGGRAQNLNTIDEVPDSSWFTNRILARPFSLEEAFQGPDRGSGPQPGVWTVTRAKQSGVTPGFTIKDAAGETWFIQFDAPRYPEAASGAAVVATKLFFALGYYQTENRISRLDPKSLKIGDQAKMDTASGKIRKMRMSDVQAILKRAHRNPDGSYRILASKGLPGKVIGGFKYYGLRKDDPNDVVPHEHRRELRALKVFGAWTNLVDMKALNTLDTVIEEGGRSIVRHYLQDVGSTFGTGALAPREWDEGYEYLYEGDKAMKRLVSLGLYLQPWQTVDYTESKSIGRFEGVQFEPEKWKPRVPTAAFLAARADDNFWAARRVMAFSDEMIHALVKTGQYSDPQAERHLAQVLIQRRDKIGKAYLPAVNPLIHFTLDPSGMLRFENAAVRAGAAKEPAGGYELAWSRFENETGKSAALGTSKASGDSRSQAPAALPSGEGAFVKLEVSAPDALQPSWKIPVQVYFRRDAGGWKLVGLERQP